MHVFSFYRIRLSGTLPSGYRPFLPFVLPLAAERIALRRVRRGVGECRIVRLLLVSNVLFFYRLYCTALC